ncbi:hypothetical protein GGX14DRAFT_620945 [Mycena pura]|uniref:Uncharacterized protein n=1 Tax=Mycena pura TaxID=153505 RepID=A0AAD6VKF9_9AGAR|nr:hypothetical protein GGX14DRAFT_620945 [Mycena pura]
MDSNHLGVDPVTPQNLTACARVAFVIGKAAARVAFVTGKARARAAFVKGEPHAGIASDNSEARERAAFVTGEARPCVKDVRRDAGDPENYQHRDVDGGRDKLSNEYSRGKGASQLVRGPGSRGARSVIVVSAGEGDAAIKKGNRHSEILLRDVKHATTLALLTGKNGRSTVFNDVEKLYAEMRRDAEKMLDDALDDILGGTWPTAHAMALDQHVAYTTFSPRRDVACLSNASGLGAQVARLSVDGKEGYTVVDCAGGARPVRLQMTPITEAWHCWRGGAHDTAWGARALRGRHAACRAGAPDVRRARGGRARAGSVRARLIRNFGRIVDSKATDLPPVLWASSFPQALDEAFPLALPQRRTGKANLPSYVPRASMCSVFPFLETHSGADTNLLHAYGDDYNQRQRTRAVQDSGRTERAGRTGGEGLGADLVVASTDLLLALYAAVYFVPEDARMWPQLLLSRRAALATPEHTRAQLMFTGGEALPHLAHVRVAEFQI